MKKLIVLALVVSSLAGCAARAVNTRTDSEMCEEAGKANFNHDGARMKELLLDADRRDKLGLTKITDDECKRYATIGAMEVRHDLESSQRMGAALQQFGNNLQRQQVINNMNRPVTTTCTGGNFSATCTTL